MNFKKRVLTGFIGLATVSTLQAQSVDSSRNEYVRPVSEQAKAVTSHCISFGFGIGGYYPYEVLSMVASPGLTIFYDNTILKHVGPGNISIGAFFSYKQTASSYMGYSNTYNYEQIWNYYVPGARIAYHIPNFPFKSVEIYAGAGAAYFISRFKFTSTDPNTNEPSDPAYYLTPNIYPNYFSPTLFAGVRSHVGNHASVWLELGYGVSTLSVGVSYKI